MSAEEKALLLALLTALFGVHCIREDKPTGAALAFLVSGLALGSSSIPVKIKALLVEKPAGLLPAGAVT